MTEPAIDLKTDVIRDRPVTETAGTVQVSQTETDDDRIILSFGGPWGVTYAELTPTEAQAVATALEHTAVRARTEEPVDD